MRQLAGLGWELSTIFSVVHPLDIVLSAWGDESQKLAVTPSPLPFEFLCKNITPNYFTAITFVPATKKVSVITLALVGPYLTWGRQHIMFVSYILL